MKKCKLLIICIALLSSNLALFSQPQAEVKNVGQTYIDSLGNEIALLPTPMRIVSLAPNVTETVAALGALDRLVGRTDYCNFPAEVASLPSIGTLYNPSVEKLIALRPDLVLASSFVSDQLITALQKASIKVVCINKQESFEGTYALIEDIALIIGKEAEGQRLVDSMKRNVAKVLEASKDLSKPRVYYMVDFGSFDGTATGDTFISQMITMAGAINIAQDATKWTYSKELLVKQNPDLIIVSPRWGETAEETLSLFSTTKPYSDLSATKKGAFILVDSDMLSRQGPRSADALIALTKAIHPEVSL
ncbi:ABC-type Fe3+-hydroxamate transport system, periplasmic component [Sphaerochaeta pleomorpha str. Grapes]|uniref:ABC-type Fe3+-hydroxamate transport system, periplasmic component n=1 Tax=Sphaerochaeta pleomorpha (strain ATCC BAA-1885 / DSM 22778 / Grapes) TaxID=158190 RepID=G8QUY8_SPHPG|nr:ABC transporter substrate-binding protein [Sphaerochaeta pleomorpha]AEV28164.1 ABC-type Fe3+-hydroxamate transport system, periplasmic component [Sphaerochaeta pleomorpha str. Grapes]